MSPLSLGAVFDQNGPVILTSVWNFCYQRDKSQPKHFAYFVLHAQSPDISNAERILWLSALGHLRWINEEKEIALKLWTEAAALAPDVIELQLNLAKIYERVGQTQRALEIVEATLPTTNDWQVEREQMILRRALAAEKKDLAKAAAERLCGLKLNPHEVVPLAEQLVKFDMTDQAEALLSQHNSMAANNRNTAASSRNPAASNRSPVDLRAQRVLLDIQLARGRHDEANQTALALLKLLETTDVRSITGQQIVTSSTGQKYIMTTVNGRQTLVPLNSVPVPEISVPEYRQHAYQALHKTGKLAALIEVGEAKLKESPRNEVFIATLMAYHAAAGNSERIGQLTLQQLEIDQGKPEKRFSAIINLLNLGRVDDAAAQAKLLMESHPDFFAPRCRDTIVRFQSKNGLRKLAKVFEQLDWSHFDKFPDLLPMVIEQLAAEIETDDIATKLFVTAFETRPERRLELLTRSPDERWWKRPELADGLRRLPIPTKESDLTNQWSVFGRAVRRPNSKLSGSANLPEGSRLTTVLIRLLKIEAERDQLKALAGEVERGRQQFPGWTAGRVLLALIDLRRERVAAGRDALIELLPTFSNLTQNSPLIPWEIADELARHDESLDTAVRFYEVALRDRGTEAWASSTSPVRGIIQSLVERGRRDDARRMLLSLLPANARRGGDPAMLPTSLELQVAQWVGRELRGIGHSIEAIHVYQAALSRAEGMTIGGHDPRVDLQSSLLIAFKELQPAALIEFFTATGDTAPQFDLQLFVSEPTTPAIRLRTRWHSVVGEMAMSPETASRMRALLGDVRRKHPDDLVTIVLSAQLALAMNDVAETAASVGALVQFVEQHPLAELSSEGAKVRQQRESARIQVGLWLIARECLAEAALSQAGTKLAERALQAAQQQTD
ncbi:MAG: hypothetical protein H7062_05835, partial [Candidatus Saccharimonas sp.]|nr:hypothetical protein [Planctomycetaceae bacterium]